MREYKGNSLLDFPNSYTVIDVETTGYDPGKDKLIEVAALKVQNNEIVDSYSSLINPGVEVSQFITELTGISNEQLAAAPLPHEVLQELYNFLYGEIIIGHNVHFDINFIYDNFLKYLGKPLCNDFIDTLRFSRKYYKNISSHRLPILAKFLKIPVPISHRALADCETTNHLYVILKEQSQDFNGYEKQLLDSMTFDKSNPFYGKGVILKGTPQYYSFEFMKSISKKCGAKFSDVFYPSWQYIVFSKYTYKNYKKGKYSEKFEKADRLANEGKLVILSEEDWCKMMGLPFNTCESIKSQPNAKNISTQITDFDETHPLYGKVCVFTGTLDKMLRKDAMQSVVDLGGQLGDSVTKKTNYLILGNNDYNPRIKDGKSTKQKKAEKLKLSGCDIDIISENVFYDMLSEI